MSRVKLIGFGTIILGIAITTTFAWGRKQHLSAQILGEVEVESAPLVSPNPVSNPDSAPDLLTSTPTPTVTPKATPQATAKPSATATPTPKPDKIITKNSNWQLKLVNYQHELDRNYTPQLTTVNNGHSFDTRAAESLRQMLADAKAAGLNPLICSSYRTWEKQTTLFANQVKREEQAGLSGAAAEKEAATKVAKPGTSEHQLGLAVDIVATDYQLLDEKQADTPENKWLTENCHKYGFIVRYPSGKSDITKVIFEPWHYRYVGFDAATEIMSRGITLEEYLGE